MTEISRDTYLKALGLMTLGNRYSQKADECRDALEELLNVPEDDRKLSHFADEIYSTSDANLDDALKKAGYVVHQQESARVAYDAQRQRIAQPELRGWLW